MGLRYRKSLSLFPGVRLNFGLTGVSVSAGVPGFRKTIHSSGRVTTTVGLPGTGLYYVDTKNNKTANSKAPSRRPAKQPTYSPESVTKIPDFSTVQYEPDNPPVIVTQLTEEAIKNIHKVCDDTVDWTEILVNATPPDSSYDVDMWSYYHSLAHEVLKGNIDVYLKLIYEVNPLADLLEYGSNFQFGTDSPKNIEVEFDVNEAALADIKRRKTSTQYNEILQDYICSICLRIARDLFALLPVKNVLVHAKLAEITVVSALLERTTFSKIHFGFVDSSDVLSGLNCNMDFSLQNSFNSVVRLTF